MGPGSEGSGGEGAAGGEGTGDARCPFIGGNGAIVSLPCPVKVIVRPVVAGLGGWNQWWRWGECWERH